MRLGRLQLQNATTVVRSKHKHVCLQPLNPITGPRLSRIAPQHPRQYGSGQPHHDAEVYRAKRVYGKRSRRRRTQPSIEYRGPMGQRIDGSIKTISTNPPEGCIEWDWLFIKLHGYHESPWTLQTIPY
eukprot:7649418-Pyramimonas_sp.AAC.1